MCFLMLISLACVVLTRGTESEMLFANLPKRKTYLVGKAQGQVAHYFSAKRHQHNIPSQISKRAVCFCQIC